MTPLEDWHDWLSSPQCLPVLEKAALYLMQLARRVGLPGELLPCRDPWALPQDEREECFRTVAHELWIFLRSRPPEWLRRLGALQGDVGNSRVFMQRIAQGFFNHLRDQARTLDRDPRRALYRRARQVLSQEHSIAYRATREGAFYSLDRSAKLSASMEGLREEGYASWESPLAVVGVQQLRQRNGLVELACFFWRQATQRLGKPCFVAVRELVHFIGCHYPDLSMPENVPLDAEGRTTGHDEERGIEIAWNGPGTDSAVVGNRIPLLAETLASSWSPRQRLVFVLTQGEGIHLKEVASRLGYSGPSGVKHLEKSVHESLRDFCLMWPGLSPPDLDMSLFEAFLLEVVEFCKKLH